MAISQFKKTCRNDMSHVFVFSFALSQSRLIGACVARGQPMRSDPGSILSHSEVRRFLGSQRRVFSFRHPHFPSSVQSSFCSKYSFHSNPLISFNSISLQMIKNLIQINSLIQLTKKLNPFNLGLTVQEHLSVPSEVVGPTSSLARSPPL